MVTLRHAFDASSMKGLVVKILRGTYPSIPSCYSQNLRDLIDEMLEKDAHKRPSVKKILEKEFLSSRISQLLSQTVAKHEFGKIFANKIPEEIKENIRDDRESQESLLSRENNDLSEEKIKTPESSSEKKKKFRTEESKESRDAKTGYEEVVNSLRQCLEERNSDENDVGDETPEQRVKSNFLTPEGCPLPGVSDIDSAFGRIEALKYYLEVQLGMERFIQTYNYLLVNPI